MSPPVCEDHHPATQVLHAHEGHLQAGQEGEAVPPTSHAGGGGARRQSSGDGTCWNQILGVSAQSCERHPLRHSNADVNLWILFLLA